MCVSRMAGRRAKSWYQPCLPTVVSIVSALRWYQKSPPRLLPECRTMATCWAIAASLLAVASAFAPGTTGLPTVRRRAVVRLCTADTEPVQLWHVQLFNDDFNMREHVSRTLMFVADISAEEANGVMQATNWGGSAIVGTWEREVAEHIGKGMTQVGSMSRARPVCPASAAEAADRPRLTEA